MLVARALAQDPELLLLDEPTAFLDAPSRVSVTGMLRRLARERGMVVVASTHDVELALRAVTSAGPSTAMSCASTRPRAPS